MRKSEVIAWLDERIARAKPKGFSAFPDDNYFQVGALGINACGIEDDPVIYAGTNGFGNPVEGLPRYAMLTFEEVKNLVETITTRP